MLRCHCHSIMNSCVFVQEGGLMVELNLTVKQFAGNGPVQLVTVYRIQIKCCI